MCQHIGAKTAHSLSSLNQTDMNGGREQDKGGMERGKKGGGWRKAGSLGRTEIVREG